MSEIVGIDLGTTFSAIARMAEGGSSEIVPNADGKNITPSVVEFLGDKKFIVGDEAKASIGINDENIAQEVKRAMGEDVTYEFMGETHTPVSISAMILKKLKEDFQRNEKYGEIGSVVVTVPANFTNEAREATKKAAEMAGLNLEHTINEPTAAALAYAVQSGQELSGKYVIYDLGGGTFDCTIASINGQDIKVETSEGVARLGGKDFDKAIIDLVSEKYKEATSKDIDLKEFTPNDAEDIKIRLSQRDKASARVSGEVIEITKEMFEAQTSGLIAQAEMAVENALARTSLEASAITDVILVGGSTRMPMVIESLKKMFGKEPKLFGNPDELVALGAALYAAYKSDSSDLNPLQRQQIQRMGLKEAAPFYFGTIVKDSESDRQYVQNIINKDEPIPCTFSETFYTIQDNQTAVNCTVTQCAADLDDPAMVRNIWEGLLDLPAGRPAGMEIEITYGYKEDGSMTCSFKDVSTGNVKNIDLNIGQGDAAPIEDSIDLDEFKVE